MIFSSICGVFSSKDLKKWTKHERIISNVEISWLKEALWAPSIVNKDGKVVVAGVNIQAHHKKPRSKDDKGGIIKSEGAIDVSNVQVVCPVCKKAVRVAHRIEDGKNVRFCKKCNATLDVQKKAVKNSKKA